MSSTHHLMCVSNEEYVYLAAPKQYNVLFSVFFKTAVQYGSRLHC